MKKLILTVTLVITTITFLFAQTPPARTYYKNKVVQERWFENANGQKHGKYIAYNEDGSVVLTANYDSGKLHGNMDIGNGEIVVMFVHGVRQGKSKFGISSGNYVNGERDGVWQNVLCKYDVSNDKYSVPEDDYNSIEAGGMLLLQAYLLQAVEGYKTIYKNGKVIDCINPNGKSVKIVVLENHIKEEEKQKKENIKEQEECMMRNNKELTLLSDVRIDIFKKYFLETIFNGKENRKKYEGTILKEYEKFRYEPTVELIKLNRIYYPDDNLFNFDTAFVNKMNITFKEMLKSELSKPAEFEYSTDYNTYIYPKGKKEIADVLLYREMYQSYYNPSIRNCVYEDIEPSLVKKYFLLYKEQLAKNTQNTINSFDLMKVLTMFLEEGEYLVLFNKNEELYLSKNGKLFQFNELKNKAFTIINIKMYDDDIYEMRNITRQNPITIYEYENKAKLISKNLISANDLQKYIDYNNFYFIKTGIAKSASDKITNHVHTMVFDDYKSAPDSNEMDKLESFLEKCKGNPDLIYMINYDIIKDKKNSYDNFVVKDFTTGNDGSKINVDFRYTEQVNVLRISILYNIVKSKFPNAVFYNKNTALTFKINGIDENSIKLLNFEKSWKQTSIDDNLHQKAPKRFINSKILFKNEFDINDVIKINEVYSKFFSQKLTYKNEYDQKILSDIDFKLNSISNTNINSLSGIIFPDYNMEDKFRYSLFVKYLPVYSKHIIDMNKKIDNILGDKYDIKKYFYYNN